MYLFTRNNKYFCNHKGHNMQKAFENELLKVVKQRTQIYDLV